MKTDALIRSGLTRGFYPEQPQSAPTFFGKAHHHLSGLVQSTTFSLREQRRFLGQVHIHGERFQSLSDNLVKKKVNALRHFLHQYGLTEQVSAYAFALVREMAGRTIGMHHFDVQILGGWVMARGGIAEMETGEGKTLTATLPAATAALAGVPVQVVTVNDYLAQRDGKLMAPVYQALGLPVGTVTSSMSADLRRQQYHRPVCYCTNKQLAFDYLRDRLLLGNDHGRFRLQFESLRAGSNRLQRLLLPGLCFAIVDEADSVLIDEARTPLVLSRKGKTSEEESCRQAINLAKGLRAGRDFTIDNSRRTINLTQLGSERLSREAEAIGGIWSGEKRREELARRALAAIHLYKRDRHYLLKDNRIVIIDENTGRLMTDRSWEQGLHQMIEVKENSPVTAQQEPMARLTYQRFFQSYLYLAGMTGTAREVRRELWSVYGLSVTRIPTHKPVRRVSYGNRFYADQKQKWSAVVQRIRSLRTRQRPVLIGTRSVAESEQLSYLLHSNGLPHRLLNARQDAQEAEIVAQAGKTGAITIATNMAGRGTDIPLETDVAVRGGLHVIVTEMNEARRIDRQIQGRCARQGDPGSYEYILSMDDEMLRLNFGRLARAALAWSLPHNTILSRYAGMLARHWAQTTQERRDLRKRRALLQRDTQRENLLAFRPDFI